MVKNSAAAADVESGGRAVSRPRHDQQQSSEAIRFERSSRDVPDGFRLATFNEVEGHRFELLYSGALHTWDISRLLDGWIDGPGYANVPVRAFRPGLGNSVVIRKLRHETEKSERKKLDAEGQRIAFLYACERGPKDAEPFLQEIMHDETGLENGLVPEMEICSPLHAAILSRDFHLCCKLLERGANVNRALGSRVASNIDSMGDKKFSSLTSATPLHLAIAFNFEKFVLECLKLKSNDLNLEAQDGAGRTAFHCAALAGNVAILKALLSSPQKKNLGLCDRAGATVLHVAAAAHSSAIVEVLLNSIEDEEFLARKNREGRSALHVAAASGNVDNAMKLIPQMINAIRQIDNFGKIPLVYAIESCHPQLISELLKNDRRRMKRMGSVDVGESIVFTTPLHYAVYMTREGDQNINSYISMLEPLLQYTLQSREMFDLFWDKNHSLYRHAKHVAVQQLLVKYLVDAGLQPKAKGTSIQRAARAGLLPLIRLLLAKQPDLIGQLDAGDWTAEFTDAEKMQVLDVKRFCNIELMYKGDRRIIDEFCRQATDQPSLDDSLGRSALVEGLASLLLNPFTGTPLTIGIYGEWGHGKSSLMQQVEVALRRIAIQQAFILPLKDSLNLTDHGKRVTGAVAKAVMKLVGEDKIKKNRVKPPTGEFILQYFVDNYNPQHHEAYRSLAITDASELLQPRKHMADADDSTINQKMDTVHPPRTPAVLTVWYNAWQYQNETEALAGLAVEIIKVMESTMNMALWLNMCWSYAWSRNRQEIYLNLFFPFTVVALLVALFSAVFWSLLSMSVVLRGYKYTTLPISFVVLLWTLSVRVYKTVQPVSCKLSSYFNPLQHESNLGYQHQVIADIKFMLTVLRTKPVPTIWKFLAKCKWIWALLGVEDHDYVSGTCIFKQVPASDMRIIVLVDDLDRCNDGTILKVLSVINLVLSVCEINVILAIDKLMVHRALKHELFNEKYIDKSMIHDALGNKLLHDQSSTEYVQKFLQKIVQLPVTLPDPTNKQIGQFLARQMGFKRNGKKQRQEEPFRPTTGLNVDQELNNNMLLARLTAQECNIMVHLQGFTEHNKRLPREWKRFLNYHRFACNILSRNAATQTFPDWKIELLVWVFVCWQWSDLMDMIIQNWRQIGENIVGSTKGQRAFQEIDKEGERIEHTNHILMGEDSNKVDVEVETSVRQGCPKAVPKIVEGEGVDAHIKQIMDNGDNSKEDLETSRGDIERGEKAPQDIEEVDEIIDGHTKQMLENEGNCKYDKQARGGERGGYAMTPHKNSKEGDSEDEHIQINLVNEDNKNTQPSLYTFISVYLDGLNEAHKDKFNSQSLVSHVLKNYNVSIEGIQIFQDFRLNCKQGTLLWPIKETQDDDSRMRRLMSSLQID